MNVASTEQAKGGVQVAQPILQTNIEFRETDSPADFVRAAQPGPRHVGYGLPCAKCGTYLGAVMPGDDRQIGIVNVNALDIRDTFDPAPPLHHYDGEDEARRRARRRKFWMPASVIA